MRRRDHDDRVGALEKLRERRRRHDSLGERDVDQIPRVAMMLVDAGDHLGLRAKASRHARSRRGPGQRRAPRSRADASDRHVDNLPTLLQVNRISSCRRCDARCRRAGGAMLPRCAHTTVKPASVHSATEIASPQKQ